MKSLSKDYINELNDMVMELPAFRDLKSRGDIHQVLNKFITDIYCDTPQELIDVFNYQLNNKMQETFYINFGIDKSYYDKLRGNIKHDMAYSLEQLFQNKGSNKLFEMYADLFENIFRKINFYNIVVERRSQSSNVSPTGTEYIYEYKLKPIYLSDPDSVIEDPQVPVHKKRKYIMELENFKDYTVWPVPTNLVYIQFCIGTEFIDNYYVFLHGVRAYANTFLRELGFNEEKSYFNYVSQRTQQFNNEGELVQSIDTLDAGDIEFLLTYFRLETLKKHQTELGNPDWNPEYVPTIRGSYLAYFENEHPENFATDKQDFLTQIETLMDVYAAANYARRDDYTEQRRFWNYDINDWDYEEVSIPGMDKIRRRWQRFLSLQYYDYSQNELDEFSKLPTVEDMRAEAKRRYPVLQDDFNFYLYEDEDSGNLFDFYIQLYSIYYSGLLSATPSNPDIKYEWVYNYIDVLFGTNIFLTADFLTEYFDPVMDLFIRYFFPVELEYIDDLLNKVKIKNKWNSIITTEYAKLKVIVRQTSIQTPIRGIDWRAMWIRMYDKHSHVDMIDKAKTITGLFKYEDNNGNPFVRDGIKNNRVISRKTDFVVLLSELTKVEII